MVSNSFLVPALPLLIWRLTEQRPNVTNLMLMDLFFSMAISASSYPTNQNTPYNCKLVHPMVTLHKIKKQIKLLVKFSHM